MRILYITIIAFVLDLLLGDPYRMPHVVRGIGTCIGKLDTYFHSLTDRLEKEEDRRQMELLCGILLCLLMLGLVWIVWTAAGAFLYRISPAARMAAECFLAYQLLAVKSLRTESMKVYRALKNGDLEGARAALSMIVGRDTAPLNQEGMIKAAVETVAENTSDGVIAPLFYLVLGGTLPMLLYKTINTMDSMIGYKNDRYRYMGTCAARLDDVVNFIPARISGLLLVASAGLGGEDAKKAWEIFKRDRKKHASPNSAQTEAAVAGALHLQLAGNAYYFGKLYEKPVIGDPLRAPETEDIRRVNRLLYIGAVLGVLVFCGLRLLVVCL